MIIEEKTGEEGKELAKKFFETLDANADGYISFQEIRDAKMDK